MRLIARLPVLRQVRHDLVLLDWSGRQLRQGNCGATPAELVPISNRLHLTGEGWVRLVHDFSRLFRRSAGTRASLRGDAGKRGRGRMAVICHTRAVFV